MDPLGESLSAEPPPPRYEEVVASEAVASSAGFVAAPTSTSDSRDATFEVDVTDPVRQGEGVSAYISFKIKTRTDHPAYQHAASEVIRRYRDFSWLHDALADAHKGVIMPAMPERNAMQKYQPSPAFVEERRRALAVYLRKLVAHPILRDTRELQVFLQASEPDWSLEMARRGAAQQQGKPPVVSGALRWFRNITHSANNMVKGKSDDSAESPEYLKVSINICIHRACILSTLLPSPPQQARCSLAPSSLRACRTA